MTPVDRHKRNKAESGSRCVANEAAIYRRTSIKLLTAICSQCLRHRAIRARHRTDFRMRYNEGHHQHEADCSGLYHRRGAPCAAAWDGAHASVSARQTATATAAELDAFMLNSTNYVADAIMRAQEWRDLASNSIIDQVGRVYTQYALASMPRFTPRALPQEALERGLAQCISRMRRWESLP